jgi:hypothetical protein
VTDSFQPIAAKVSVAQRLYKKILGLKVLQVVVILVSVSIILYILNSVGSIKGLSGTLFVVFTQPIFLSLADVCLTSAIVGLTFELLVKSESEASLREMVNGLLDSQTVAILDGIIHRLFLRQDLQREMLKNEKLEEIILNALKSRFSDGQIGEGIFDGVIRKAIAYDEYWSNYRYEIFLQDITDRAVSEAIRQQFFDVIMRITYDVTLRKTRFVFVCANTQDQFNELLRNPEYEVRWMSPSTGLFPIADERTFEVLQMTVDETELKIVPSKKEDGAYEVVCEGENLSHKVGQKVTVSYTFKVKVFKSGHEISTTVTYPTHDVTIEFNFAKASIDYVEVLDYFVSSRRPSIRYIPNRRDTYKITVELKEWAFPKGGAVFVWMLKGEEDYLRKGVQPARPQGNSVPSPKRR